MHGLVVVRPKSKKIGCRWVLRTKYTANGEIERRNKRLVAKGYTQLPSVDHHETTSLVTQQYSIRLLLALSVELGFILYQMNVVMAYINRDLEEEIYMEQAS